MPPSTDLQPDASLSSSPVAQPPEPRQRWRVLFRRGPVPADHVGRVAIEAWQATLAGSGLRPAQLDAAGRPRIAFGAPLPAAADGEAELAEFWLLDRVPLWRLREALADRMPPAHVFVSAEDTWLGAPPLAGRVVAADWRAQLVSGSLDAAALAAAAERLLATTTLPRIRAKSGGDKPYDLRPLLLDVRLSSPAAGTPTTVQVRTRFHPELGSGRPEEVVAALADAAGVPLEIARITRLRLLLVEDIPAHERLGEKRPPAATQRLRRAGHPGPR